MQGMQGFDEARRIFRKMDRHSSGTQTQTELRRSTAAKRRPEADVGRRTLPRRKIADGAEHAGRPACTPHPTRCHTESSQSWCYRRDRAACADYGCRRVRDEEDLLTVMQYYQ